MDLFVHRAEEIRDEGGLLDKIINRSKRNAFVKGACSIANCTIASYLCKYLRYHQSFLVVLNLRNSIHRYPPPGLRQDNYVMSNISLPHQLAMMVAFSRRYQGCSESLQIIQSIDGGLLIFTYVARRLGETDISPTIRDLFFLTRYCLATDPRGRIFAIAGLQTSLALEIHYSNLVQELYNEKFEILFEIQSPTREYRSKGSQY